MFRKPARRSNASRRIYHPDTLLLEDRCTPTVNTLAVLGLTPGMGGAGKLTLAGLVSESNTIAATTLSVTYQVLDSTGAELASGSLTPKNVLPKSSLIGVSTTITVAMTPGSTETLILKAVDTDMGGVPMTATASLYVAPNRGVSTMGIGLTEGDGDTYLGGGMGQVVLTSQVGGGFLAKGNGFISIASNPNNNELLNASGNGRFTLGLGPHGNLGLTIAKGHGVLNYAKMAGDTTATGGFSLGLAGNLSVTRYADSTITASARGDLSLKAEIGSTSSTNTTPTTLTATGRKAALDLKTDNTGKFKLALGGKFKLAGSLGGNNLGLLG